MNVRHFALAAALLMSTSAALAAAPAPQPVAPQPPAREQSLLEELASGMRELLRAVAPEIALPAIDLKLPKLDLR